MQLRPYQQSAKSAINAAWQQGDNNVLAVLPTGAGKTVLFGSIVHDHKGADKKTLVPQVEAELKSVPVNPQQPTPSMFAGDTAPPPPVAEQLAGPPTTFTELIPLITAGKTSGKISDGDIANACAALGLEKFGSLAIRTDLIAQFAVTVGV